MEGEFQRTTTEDGCHRDARPGAGVRQDEALCAAGGEVGEDVEHTHGGDLSLLARRLLSCWSPPAESSRSPNRPPENPMARSLNVKHEEKLGTSPLLNTFLALAVAWMAVGAFLSNLAEAAPAVTP